MAPRRPRLIRAVVAVGAVITPVVPASAAPVVLAPWFAASSGGGGIGGVSRGVTAFPDGTSVAVGYFTGTDVDFGDGVPRTSAGGGTRESSFVQKISAQGRVLWVRTVAGGTFSRGFGVAPRPDGGVVVAGPAGGSGLDFGDGVSRTSAGQGNGGSAFVEALAPDGSVQWVRLSDAPVQQWTETFGNAVAAVPDGGVVVVGDFQGVGVDLGDGIPRTSSGNGLYGRYSSFAQRRAAGGAVMWTITSTSAPAAQVTASGVSAMPDGEVIVVGDFTGVAVDLGDGTVRASANGGTEASAFIQRLSARGTVIWTKTTTGTGSAASRMNGVAALPDGGVIAAGTFDGTGADLGDGVPRTSAGGGVGRSAFTQRRRADGSVAWTRVTGGSASSITTAFAASTLPDGSTWVAGDFQGTGVDLGDGVPRTSGNGGAVTNFSSFVQKRDADGTLAWTRASTAPLQAFTDTTAYGVSALPDGTAVVAGAFAGTGVDFGDGVGRTSAVGGTRYSTFSQQLMDAPIPPAAPVAAAGDGSATVTVTPLAGGSVTAYRVAARPGSGGCTIVSPATACTVDGLTNGTAYTFSATATNAAGTSAASGSSAAVTPRAPAQALAPRMLPARTRLASGQSMVLGIRARNAGATAIVAVTACTRLPAGLVVVRRNGALRSGRTVCFRMGDLPGRGQRTKTITVRAVSAHAARVALRARASSVSIVPRTSVSRAVVVRITPRAGRLEVTG